MCNLYSQNASQNDIIGASHAINDASGNLQVMSAIFPDTIAPVVYNRSDNIRELGIMRWGFAPPQGLSKQLVTNVRNTASPFWRAWLKPEFRCLIPVTSFCEYADTKPKKTPNWFALNEERPLFFFAGIWRPWIGVKAETEGEHKLFAFLTTDANELMKPIHPKAMPVILTKKDDIEQWLNAPVRDAVDLQRPCANDILKIVATSQRYDKSHEIHLNK